MTKRTNGTRKTKTAIITGGSRGIGFSIASALAEDGWTLGLLARNPERLKEAANKLEMSGAVVEVAAANLQDFESTQRALDYLLQECGTPELLVNNAGRADAEVPVWEADVREWKDVWETNMLGPVHVERIVIPKMIENGGGRIINIVSGAGVRDAGIFTAYSSSKAALIRHTGDLATSGAPVEIKAFAVSPGIIDTDLARSLQVNAHISEYPPVDPTLDLITAIGSGELDDWSGAYLRPTVDTVASLKAARHQRIDDPEVRSLGILSWGPDDPIG